MKKLTRKRLADLAKVMPILNYKTQKILIGGGDGSFGNPYTYEEYLHLQNHTQLYYLDAEGSLCYDLSDIEVYGLSGSYLFSEGSGIINSSGYVGVSGSYEDLSNNGSGNYYPWESLSGEDYGDASFWKWFFDEEGANDSTSSGGSGNESYSILGLTTFGLGTAGNLGKNAGYILDDRGNYMPKGAIQSFTLKHPITVRLPIGGIETNSQILNVIRVGGNYFGIMGDFLTATDIYKDFKSGNESTALGKLAFAIAENGCAYIPGYGWAISLGLGVVEQFIFE